MDCQRYLSQLNKINEKVDLDNEFPDWNKAVQFITEGGDSFFFVVDNGKVSQVDTGKLDIPDITITGDAQSISDLFEGRLSIIGGFITKKLQINGSVGDAVGANALIQAARLF